MASIADILLDQKIRVLGTVDEPLFHAKDVGRYLGDNTVRRVTGTYDLSLRRLIRYMDVNGRLQTTSFLTERGLYYFLMNSKRPLAKEFQEHVRTILLAERHRQVAAADLEAKLRMPVEFDDADDVAAAVPEPVAGTVYFIRAGDNPAVKIGCTRHRVNRRVRELQVGNELPLRLVAQLAADDMVAAERLAHAHFAARHVRGEWFTMGDDEAAEYCDARQPAL